MPYLKDSYNSVYYASVIRTEGTPLYLYYLNQLQNAT